MKFITRILGQFQQQMTSGDSAPLAKERLKVALTYDRNGLEQGTVENLREEIVRLMAQHLDVSAEDIQVDIDDTTGPNKLVASIALRPPRRPRAVAAGSGLG